MIYRPQFAYRTPPGCRDIDFIYYFDGSNTPALNQDVSGQTLNYIPLTLEQDAPFLWRGWKVNAGRKQTSGGNPDGYTVPVFTVRFEDWAYNKLQDDFVRAVDSGYPQNPWTINQALLTGPPVPFPGEIICPPGSTQFLFITATNVSGADKQFVSVSLYGTKRFQECA